MRVEIDFYTPKATTTGDGIVESGIYPVCDSKEKVQQTINDFIESIGYFKGGMEVTIRFKDELNESNI